MTVSRALLDTGPLVAILNERDAAHGVCAAALQSLAKPLVSSWAVLAEAAWLLRRDPLGCSSLMRLVANSIVVCPPLDKSAAAWIDACEQRYADLRPQLADMTLLYLAEREQIDIIFTLDRRDFTVFRDSRQQAFQLVPASHP